MNLSRETPESIQNPKRSKRDPSCCGAVDAVGSDVGILLKNTLNDECKKNKA